MQHWQLLYQAYAIKLLYFERLKYKFKLQECLFAAKIKRKVEKQLHMGT